MTGLKDQLYSIVMATFQAIQAAGGMLQLAQVAGGGTYVILNGRAVLLTADLAAELGITAAAYHNLQQPPDSAPCSNSSNNKTNSGNRSSNGEGSGGEKSHGNELDDKPAEGYTLRDKKTGEVKKYGETTKGEDRFGKGNQKRYSKKELRDKDVDYVKETSGTKKEMHKWQHEKIIEYKNKHGKRPELNKNDYEDPGT